MADKNNNKTEKAWKLITVETIGMVLILFSTLCLVCVLTNDIIFGVIGSAVSGFLLGFFGFFSIIFFILIIILSVRLVKGEGLNLPLSIKVLAILNVVLFFFLFHAISVRNLSLADYSSHLSSVYQMGDSGLLYASGGGALFALLDGFLAGFATRVGSYVIYGLFILLIAATLVYKIRAKYFYTEDYQERSKRQERAKYVQIGNVSAFKDYPVEGLEFQDLDKDGEKINKLFTGKNAFSVVNSKNLRACNEKRINYKSVNDNETALRVATVTSAEDNKAKEKTINNNSHLDDQIKYVLKNEKMTEEEVKKLSKNKPVISKEIPNKTKIPKFSVVKDDIILQTNEISDIANNNIEEIETPFNGANSFVNNQQTASTARQSLGGESLKAKEQNGNAAGTSPSFEENKNNFESKNGKNEKDKDYSYAEFLQQKAKEAKEENFSPLQDDSSQEEYESGLEDFKNGDNDFEIIDGSEDGFAPVDQFELTDEEDAYYDDIMKNDSYADDEDAEDDDMQGTPFSGQMQNSQMQNGQMQKGQVGGQSPRGQFNSQEESFSNTEQDEQEKPIIRVYNKPPTTIFKVYPRETEIDENENKERIFAIEEKFKTFKIPTSVVGTSRGPTVTRYELKLDPSIRVSRVAPFSSDLQMALRAKNGIIIEAPIPGKDLFGVQVENTKKEIVGIRELLESKVFQSYDPKKLIFILGKNVEGEAVVDNLAKAPHMLIAGTTGSGKSVAINVLITSMMMKYTPEEVRFVLVDPKFVTFRKFENMPHLLVNEIFTNVQRTLFMFDYLIKEMDRRYDILSSHYVEDLEEYNDIFVEGEMEKFPRIVVVFDEVNDFMIQTGKVLDDKISALAAKARACGIHLVFATQRPSAEVMTGTVKANFPTRISFRVNNSVDSVVLIGSSGCEKLLGNGDMLFRNSLMPDYVRYQGAYISNGEMKSFIEYIKNNNTCYYDERITQDLNSAVEAAKPVVVESGEKTGRADEVYIDAVKYVVKNKTATTSDVQAFLCVGYPVALKVMNRLIDEGVIAMNEGQRSRRVIMSVEEAKDKYGF